MPLRCQSLCLCTLTPETNPHSCGETETNPKATGTATEYFACPRTGAFGKCDLPLTPSMPFKGPQMSTIHNWQTRVQLPCRLGHLLYQAGACCLGGVAPCTRIAPTCALGSVLVALKSIPNTRLYNSCPRARTSTAGHSFYPKQI